MLSPMELQNKQIQTNKKKYDRAEMDEYLELVFENYKELYEANKDLKKKIKALSDGVQYYRSIESTLQKALILAEKTSKETKDAAILKAEAIEKDANTKADQIVAEAESEYNSIKGRCVSLVQQFNQYKVQLKQAASAQLELINSDSFDIYSPEMEALVDTESRSHGKSRNVAKENTSIPPLAPIPTVVPQQTAADSVAMAESVAMVEPVSAPEPVSTPEPVPVKKQSSPVSFEEVKSLDEIYPEVEASPEEPHVAAVKEATVLEPIEAVTQTPVDAKPIEAIKGQTLSFEEDDDDNSSTIDKVDDTKSLDSLLSDLSISSKKKKSKNSDEEDDPFEFLGSIDDF